uniref:Uncharacterized protein n=1 Tax=viral metagenome TaxID=1070528 RepID=A0A6C0B7M3_9ZZZZ
MTKSKKRIIKRRRTLRKSIRTQTPQIVHTFLQFLNMIKLYHWKTRSYSQHKATDELYGRLNETIDRFVEVLLGKDQSRIKDMEHHMKLINTDDMVNVKERVFEYRAFLIEFNTYFDQKKDSDLLSIRDEILADVNQFLYLLSFDKV